MYYKRKADRLGSMVTVRPGGFLVEGYGYKNIYNVGNIQNDLEMALKRLVRDKGEGKLVISYLRSSYLLGNFNFLHCIFQFPTT